jgi:hypothetical protein
MHVVSSSKASHTIQENDRNGLSNACVANTLHMLYLLYFRMRCAYVHVFVKARSKKNVL